VEVDGPSHYTCSWPHRDLGGTVLRRRLLEAAGWVVVNVPLYEWRDAGDKVAYMMGKLRGL
jgi:hypothetical protein